MTHGFRVLGLFSLALSALSSSPSLVLSLNASRSSSEASRRTKTSRLASGDQAKSSTSCGVSVRRCASPPDRLSSQAWVLPSFRADRKARYLPSGLQRGWLDETFSAVIGTGSPPPKSTGLIPHFPLYH